MLNKILKTTFLTGLALTVTVNAYATGMPNFGAVTPAPGVQKTAATSKNDPVFSDAARGISITRSELKKEYNINIPAIMYHKFSEKVEEQNEWCISTDQLKADFIEYKNAGFTPVTISEYRLLSHLYKTAAFSDDAGFAENAAAFLALYEKYPNPILLTVDDGYDDGYEVLLPLLEEFGFKANVSIVGLYSEKSPNYLSAEEIREMAISGLVEFGNHTYELHEVPFEQLDAMYKDTQKKAAVKADYVKNENFLSGILGTPSAYFTYPNGLYSDMTEEILTEMGVQVSLTTNSSDDLITLNSGTRKIPRINRANDVGSADFVKHVIGKISDQSTVDVEKHHASLLAYYEGRAAEEPVKEELEKEPAEEAVAEPEKIVLPKEGKLAFGFNDKKYEFQYKNIDGEPMLKLDDVYAIESAFVNFLGSVCRVTFRGKTVFVKGMTDTLVSYADRTYLERMYIPAREMFEKLGYTVDVYPSTGDIIVY